MSISIITNFKTTHWSGGTTTELFIFPENADFAKREFDFRLSIATINDDYSVFTALHNTHRTLLLLEGEIKLVHECHHEKTLLPYQFDQFEGDWRTESFGTGKDFNVMTKGDRKAQIEHMSLVSKMSKKIELEPNVNRFIYCHSGEIEINNIKLVSNQLAQIENEKDLEITTSRASNLILVSIIP